MNGCTRPSTLQKTPRVPYGAFDVVNSGAEPRRQGPLKRVPAGPVPGKKTEQRELDSRGILISLLPALGQPTVPVASEKGTSLLKNPHVNADWSLRLQYELIPVVLSADRAKRHLNVLVARTSLDEAAAHRLVRVQLAKWYCDDLADEIELTITIFIPENAIVVRTVFDLFAAEYQAIPDLDETNINAISQMALALDCDLVIAADVKALGKELGDDFALVDDDVDAVLHAVEIHLRGFDIPWSFEFLTKNQPWTNFYAMCAPRIFTPLLREHADSAKAGADVAEVMRSLVADALPSMCFTRDRVEFYRQQERWAERTALKRQEFRFEYNNALNQFYLTLYAAVDQVAALTVYFYHWDTVPEDAMAAMTSAFRRARKAEPAIDAVFSDAEFWDMYELPRLLRHHAAHRGPIVANPIYTSDEEFTDAQLDAAAEKNGYYDDLRFFEKKPDFSEGMRTWLISMARFKAKLKLLGRPLKHAVLLKNGGKAVFYYPSPAHDFDRFLGFLNRVLAIIRPWDRMMPTMPKPNTIEQGGVGNPKI